MGSLVEAYGARKASKQQAQAGREGLAMQRSGLDDANALLDPYRKAGGVAQNELMAMLGIGGQTSSYENPMLKQIQEQTLQSMTNRAAATGRGTGSDMASTIAQSMFQPAYQMQQNRMGQLQAMQGLGANVAGNQASMTANMANAMAGSQVNIGNAQAAGTAGMYGGIGQHLNQAAGMAGMAMGGPMPSMGGGGGAGGQQMYRNTALTQPSWNQNIFGNGSGFGNVTGGGNY